jgi:hypothetical protein
MEDEQALLAELRAISNRSSSASRFADDANPNAEEASEAAVVQLKAPDSPQKKLQSSLVQRHAGAALPPWMRKSNSDDSSKGTLASEPLKQPGDIVSEEEKKAEDAMTATKSAAVRKHTRASPPWKRKAVSAEKESHTAAPQQQLDAVEILVAEPPPSRAMEPKPTSNNSTFAGERGGAAEDAELLALLRGVSAKSSSASRFDDTDGCSTQNLHVAAPASEPAMVLNADDKSALSTNKRGPPPWQRKSAISAKQQQQPDVEISIKAPEPRREEPMRASSLAARRFDDGSDCISPVETQQSEEQPSDVAAVEPLSDEPPKAVCPTRQATLPPWKRKRPVSNKDYVDVLVPADNRDDQALGSIKSDLPQTFQGDRGGAAEDAELLALLRGVSNRSADSRFSEPTQTDESRLEFELQNVPPLVSENRVAESKPKIVRTPPWKRKPNAVPETTGQTVTTLEVAKEPPAEAQEPEGVEHSTKGLKSDLPSTFQGDRGGTAEDAELLALLRGVSAKSAASRFGDESAVESVPPLSTNEPHFSAPERTVLPPRTRSQTRAAPEHQQTEALSENVDSFVSAPSYGIKSEFQSTFKGDRGGAAEDAELLSLLRGVTAQSGRDRFSDAAVEPKSDPAPKPRTTRQVVPEPIEPELSVAETPTPTSDEVEVTRENVPKCLTDKNWKVRSQAYDVLLAVLKDLAMSSNDLIDSEIVLEGLGDRIASFVEDGNASALDKALEFANLYADRCRGAGDADRARKIVASLIRKSALSSRPSSLKLASALTLKLMEVGRDGAKSVHSVVDLLLTEGLAAKKPKVVQAAASLILEASYDFGAASLPIASINLAAPKWLTHSNAMVRDCCLKVLAEICRVLGSKAPIQSVVDSMKKAQLSELDSQLSEQPEPTPIRTGLRSSSQSTSSTSRETALAALEAGTKELEAQRFAARPAVDFLAAVVKTDYAAQIALTKWSEKVAALDKLLESGGEKPYKLMQPSSSVNYGPLVADTRKLLSHTHFAVCTKAIQVLSMLAEGAGEKLYPSLRPALTPLLQLSKDKKLTGAVSSGLDALFGNVLSIESLMDNDDAIPSAVDEKLQKNALARATAVEFLLRCLARNGSAGPKGKLTSKNVAAIINLSIRKIDDSDAAVRKASMSIIEVLVRNDIEEIAEKASSLVASLQSSNPRAFKSLSKVLDSNGLVKQTDIPSSRMATTNPTSPSKKPSSDRTALDAPNTIRTLHNSTVATGPSNPSSSLAPRNDKKDGTDRHIPRFEDALLHITGLGIPLWDASEDDGGILVGLRGTLKSYIGT